MTSDRPLGYPPPMVRAVNTATSPLRTRAKSRYPNAATLVEMAVARTGLDDFGPGAVLEPLDRLLAPLENDPTMTTGGLVAWPRLLLRLLTSRLEIVEYVRQNPAVVDVELDRPIIITGMPRTGTTLLYNLVSSMPGARPLLGWESLQPLPTRSVAARKAAYRAWVRFVNMAIPALRTIHPLPPDGPDEGLETMDRTLLSFNLGLYNYGYVDWLLARDRSELNDAWQVWKWQLQILQQQRSGQYWVLKAPTYLGLFPTVDALVPNARWVMTHRDLGEAIPSAMSLVTVVGAVLREAGATIDLPRFADRMAEMAHRTHADIQQRPNVEVLYPELVNDPTLAVRDVLETFGERVPADLDARVKRYLEDNPKDKHGAHRYSLATFGLSPDDLEPFSSTYAAEVGLDQIRP